MYLGVKAVIARSIERIHQANLCNFGIVPLTFQNEEDYQAISQGDQIEIADLYGGVKSGKVELQDLTNGNTIILDCITSTEQKEMLFAGGLLNLLKK